MYGSIQSMYLLPPVAAGVTKELLLPFRDSNTIYNFIKKTTRPLNSSPSGQFFGHVTVIRRCWRMTQQKKRSHFEDNSRDNLLDV